MPSAKRAVLKSLVREIRTQGSARGQSGNWLFYLDVRQAKLVISCKVKVLAWRTQRNEFIRPNQPPVSSVASPAERC